MTDGTVADGILVMYRSKVAQVDLWYRSGIRFSFCICDECTARGSDYSQWIGREILRIFASSFGLALYELDNGEA